MIVTDFLHDCDMAEKLGDVVGDISKASRLRDKAMLQAAELIEERKPWQKDTLLYAFGKGLKRQRDNQNYVKARVEVLRQLVAA